MMCGDRETCPGYNLKKFNNRILNNTLSKRSMTWYMLKNFVVDKGCRHINISETHMAVD